MPHRLSPAWRRCVFALQLFIQWLHGVAPDAFVERSLITQSHHPTPVDQINEAFYQRDRDIPLAQVLQSFRSSHQELQAMLDGMSDADLSRTYTPAGRSADNGTKIAQWIAGDSYEHYDEHRETMQRLL